MSLLTLLTARDYFAEITQKIQNAGSGDRVALMTMAFDPNERVIQFLVDELVAAAKRGAVIHCNVDAYSFMIHDATELPTGPHLKQDKPSLWRNDFKQKHAVLKTIESAGGHYRITNVPCSHFSNPFAGRSHIKCTVINNHAYLGGCNLKGADQTDAMVRLNHHETVDWIYNFILHVNKVGTVGQVLSNTDATVPVDETTSLLIDAGMKKRSLIYEAALQLIDDAQTSLTMTCQFFPGSTTAHHLANAIARGVDVNVYFNNPRNKASWLKSLPMLAVQRYEQYRLPRQLFLQQLDINQPYLHAKLLASEKAAMIGSHNYVIQGVNFGTAEAAILCQDAKFAERIKELCTSSL